MRATGRLACGHSGKQPSCLALVRILATCLSRGRMSGFPPSTTRRAVTLGLAVSVTSLGAHSPALPSTGAQPGPKGSPQDAEWRLLTAAPARVRLRPEPAPETEVWAFDGTVPGPVLRARHG